MAVPELSVAVPSVAAPSLNVTVPDGVKVEEALGFTVAVKLTCWPKTDELVEEESVVVVAAAVAERGANAKPAGGALKVIVNALGTLSVAVSTASSPFSDPEAVRYAVLPSGVMATSFGL
jgi:hypothetical protein